MAPTVRSWNGDSVQVVLDNLPLVVVLAAGLFAPLTGWFAGRRSRNPAVWFVFGAVLGPIALLLLALAPPGRCPSCEAPIPGWSGSCPRCGTRLGAATASRRPIVPRDAPTRETVSLDPASAAALDAVVGRRARPTISPAIRPLSFAPELVPDPALAASLVPSASTAGEVLSTGIYLSGNARLEIGACYALSRVGERWRVFGPVDAGQLTIRHEGSLDTLDVTAMDDRVILTTAEGRSSMAIVMRPIGGMRAADLERALVPRAPGGPRGASGVAS
jgi:hypothetical protein